MAYRVAVALITGSGKGNDVEWFALESESISPEFLSRKAKWMINPQLGPRIAKEIDRAKKANESPRIVVTEFSGAPPYIIK